MSLTAITEIGQRGGSLQMEGLQRVYRRTYQVSTSGATVEPLEILTSTTSGGVRLPRIGESYVGANGYYDTGAIVDDLQLQQPNDDHPDYWVVTVTWKSHPSNLAQNTQGSGGGSPGAPESSNPIFQPPKVTWGSRKKMVPTLVTTALDTTVAPANFKLPPLDTSVPIATTAGTPYEPTPQKEVPYRTLQIVRNELEFRPFTTHLYPGRVNDRIFQRQPKGCAICEDIDAEYAYADGISYFVVTYRFSFAPLREDGTNDPFFWYPQYLNRGPKYLEGGKLQTFKTREGVGGGQGYLAEDGTVLPGFDKTEMQLAAGTTPLTLIFPNRKMINFDELGLPDPAWL